ncbi:GNAT family N-acetyltransferase [Paractinoplanes maris]|uniref:GNAT family N-acetyltransferase n=1 Tax=Paractinoplanes maris TaxID=1734446 RepID=UPI0020218A6F|nr:GNAT family N-acetyltransferase [Actinoplanes maris]
MIIRDATTLDLEAIATVSLAAGQPATDSGADARYTNLVLGQGSVVVAVQPDGVVAGWGAARPTPVGAMLSDLFVDPGQHGRGVGGRLLRRLWPGRPGTPGRFTFSSRHPSALPLYAKAGLLPRWPLLYLTGDPQHLPVVPAMRATVVGADQAAAADAHLTTNRERTADYRYWAGSGGTGLLVHDGDRLVAAGAGRHDELTHLTCSGADQDAVAVVAALARVGGSQVTVRLPGPHPMVGELLRRGWRVEDYDLAMTTPDLQLPTTWAYSPGLA